MEDGRRENNRDPGARGSDPKHVLAAVVAKYEHPIQQACDARVRRRDMQAGADMIVRYIVERYTIDRWEQASEIPFNVGSEEQAYELMKGAQLRHPETIHRVEPRWMTDAEFATQEHTQKLERILDDILRQVVCDCGTYHGVGWMPEGSGEGLSVAVEILRKAGL